MQKMLNKYFLYWLIFLSIISCTEKKCREVPKLLGEKPNIEIIRFEDKIEQLATQKDALDLINAYPLFSETFMQRSQLPDDSILTNDLLKLAKDPYIDTMYRDVKNNFADLSWLKTQLEDFYHHVKSHYPDTDVPKVYTMVSGFGTDLFVHNKVIVIGLEYFLGKDGKYIPPMLPGYILRRLTKEHLVASIAIPVADGHIEYDILDNSMMNEMIKWGKIYYFLENTLPCTHDSIIAGYTAAELKEVQEHKAEIWSHFVEKKLFYETDHFLIKKYCDERPKVLEIGNNCPGRIGRWLGWQVIKKYAKVSGLSLPAILSEQDAKKIFVKANYKPV
jgi:hypothetical protein